jgi:hypothetical protein
MLASGSAEHDATISGAEHDTTISNPENIILHMCISHDGVLLYIPCAHAWLLFVLTQPVG